MSLSTKIFLLVLFATAFLIVCMWFANLFIFEDTYLVQKEKDYTELAGRFALEYSGDIQESFDLIGMFEDKYGLNVTITDEVGIIQYTTVIKGNPWGGTASRWKNDIVSIPADVRDNISAGRTAVYYTKNEIYGSEIMNVAVSLTNGEILILEMMIEPVKESINTVLRYYLYISLGALLLGLAFSYVISLRVSRPVSKINIIANRMAGGDYSIKYNYAHNDEIDEIGEALNTMSEKLDSAQKQISHFTARIQGEAERERKIERKKQEFISNVSHELKTPVSVINSYAKGLLNDLPRDREELEYYCRVLEDESSKMMELISELLEISILDKEDYALNFVNFDIVSLIENVRERYQKELDEKNIDFYLCKKYDSVTVKGDPLRIEQVVVNLFTNAMKYAADEKGIVIKILKGEKRTVVKVFNTGKQIPEDEFDKIWESFYRIERTPEREKGSTGLGLYIVRKVLKMHKSRYGVRNLKGGVEFWFDIESF